jgi:glycine/D-amino acid oxidase-like deaminating enzyme/nitrite reductase/ring-hydroxylating ferredoxin subunit
MITRDGNTISLWQPGADGFKSTLVTDQRKFDVAIAGAGITGLTTGLLLQRLGKSVIIFDSWHIGFGTTGGTTAHINTLLDTPYPQIIDDFGKEKAKLVAQAAKDALALIAEHVTKFHIECGYSDANAFIFSQSRKENNELQGIHEACRDVGVETEFVNELPIGMEFDHVLMVKHQAKFNPIEYLYGLALEFEKAGGVIRQNCRVDDVNGKDPLSIETTDGMFESKAFVFATHIPPGVNLLHLRCVPQRSYAMAVRLAGSSYPQGLIYDMKDPYNYYRSQIVNGVNYLIAGGFDHKTAHKSNTAESFLQLEAHVREHFAVEEIAHKWSSQYYESVDGLPYIGHLPGKEDNVYVATGFGGNGMTYSQVAARVITHQIMKLPCPYAGVFHPSRIKPVAGFTNFVAHNADVAAQFSHKWLPLDEIEELSSLAPGEGKVVKYNDESIALHKDHLGNLHAVRPICTHLGCSVTWNIAEQSWDCPCHGARYSMDGTVLNGPASQDLERIVLEEPLPKPNQEVTH